jgi:hypothetical protein
MLGLIQQLVKYMFTMTSTGLSLLLQMWGQKDQQVQLALLAQFLQPQVQQVSQALQVLLALAAKLAHKVYQ